MKHTLTVECLDERGKVESTFTYKPNSNELDSILQMIHKSYVLRNYRVKIDGAYDVDNAYLP